MDDIVAATLVMMALADENERLRACLMDLEADAATYREIAIAALDALRDLTVETDRVRAREARVGDELRSLYQDLAMKADAAA